MSNVDNKQPAGSLKISREVLASIAGTAAKEIEGVADLAAFSTNIKTLFTKKQSPKSVVINLNDDVATVDVHVILKSGAKIPDVSERIQTAVKEAIQNMTGITVARVNIGVSGIEFEEKEPEIITAQ